MKIKIITNHDEYREAQAYIDMLIEKDLNENSDLIGVLALLVDKFEVDHFNLGLPDPVSAIEFRMEQLGLSRKDLVPYLGSQSRVSEILNGKKTLSLSMIRKLHEGLGISYDVLMQEQDFELDTRNVDYNDYPIVEMFKQGFFSKVVKSATEAKDRAEELIKGLFEPVGVIPFDERNAAHLRSSVHHITNKCMDTFALQAWQALVLTQAKKITLPNCELESINLDFMQDVLKLSSLEKGPLLAKERLADNGIHLIFQPHLAKTYLDGAVMWGADDNPVIGMTARYDRLDNFWFVLMHELAHVSLHLKDTNEAFFDDVEGGDRVSKREAEADQLALDALMPKDEWSQYLDLLTTPSNVIALSKKLSVNPAIIAGRYRKETRNYRIFNRLIGSKEVRKLVLN